MELSCLGLTIICRDRIYFGFRISLPGDCGFGVDGDVASGSVIGCSVVGGSAVGGSVVFEKLIIKNGLKNSPVSSVTRASASFVKTYTFLGHYFETEENLKLNGFCG